MTNNSTDAIAGPAVAILVFSLFAGIGLSLIIGGLVFGAITGGVAGAGVLGYRAYKKRKSLGPWDEKADAAGFGLFEPGGVFLGEEVKWD